MAKVSQYETHNENSIIYNKSENSMKCFIILTGIISIQIKQPSNYEKSNLFTNTQLNDSENNYEY